MLPFPIFEFVDVFTQFSIPNLSRREREREREKKKSTN